MSKAGTFLGSGRARRASGADPIREPGASALMVVLLAIAVLLGPAVLWGCLCGAAERSPVACEEHPPRGVPAPGPDRAHDAGIHHGDCCGIVSANASLPGVEAARATVSPVASIVGLLPAGAEGARIRRLRQARAPAASAPAYLRNRSLRL